MLTHDDIARICWGATGTLLEHWGHDFGTWAALLPTAREALAEITKYAGESPPDMHARWCDFLRADGWDYSGERDGGRQRHPWICDWPQLDEGGRLFFKLHRNIVIFLALEYPEGSDFAQGLTPRRLPAT